MELVRDGGQRDRVLAVAALVLSVVLVALVVGVLPTRFGNPAATDADASSSLQASEPPRTVGGLRGCLREKGFGVARSGERRLIAKRSGFRPTTMVVLGSAEEAREAAKGRWTAIGNVALRYGRTGDPARSTAASRAAFTACLQAVPD